MSLKTDVSTSFTSLPQVVKILQKMVDGFFFCYFQLFTNLHPVIDN